ncbi:hypothetical protein LX36DRAFT_317466 [Colletotrichum falcatum]|nr:hypothetical protein LX36DRAFT_317466 [Colletotrichum falcatum]
MGLPPAGVGCGHVGCAVPSSAHNNPPPILGLSHQRPSPSTPPPAIDTSRGPASSIAQSVRLLISGLWVRPVSISPRRHGSRRPSITNTCQPRRAQFPSAIEAAILSLSLSLFFYIYFLPSLYGMPTNQTSEPRAGKKMPSATTTVLKLRGRLHLCLRLQQARNYSTLFRDREASSTRRRSSCAKLD